MPIDTITREQFEAALPLRDGKQGWESLGLIKGEYAYLFPLKNGMGIHIRSSIKGTGVSADSGEDSIRCWIVDAQKARQGDNRPLGGKISKWTTRKPGWALRLWNPKAKKGVIWDLSMMAIKIRPCPKCETRLLPFKVKKEGENKGRSFLKCDKCSYFEWI